MKLGKIVAVVGAAVFFALLSVLAIGGIGPINSVTRMFAGDGTVSAPAYSFRSETNSGLFRRANSVLTVGIAGANVLDFGPNYFAPYVNMLFVTDNANDIGQAGAFRPRTLYTATSVSTTKISFNSFTFVNIGSNITANGEIGFCQDCTIANPCAGGGTGALAKRLNGVNVCN